jgi:hypothetical protein
MTDTQARQLLANAVYGPNTLEVIGKAFDAAWESIAANFGDDPVAVEAARLKLATAILAVAQPDSSDVDALKLAALEAMAPDLPVRSGP